MSREEEERDLGMNRAAMSAGEEWNALCQDTILGVGRRKAEFTADDVRPLLPEPTQRKAMGANFNALARTGYIEHVRIGYNNIQGGHKGKFWVWRLK